MMEKFSPLSNVDIRGLIESFQSKFLQKEKLPQNKRGALLSAMTAGVIATVGVAGPAFAGERGKGGIQNNTSIEIAQRNKKDSPRVYVDAGEGGGYYVGASAESLTEIKKQNRMEDFDKFDLKFTTHGLENVRTIDQAKDLVDPSRYGLMNLNFFHPATNEVNLKIGEYDGKKVLELTIQDDDGSKTSAYVDLKGALITIQ